MTDLSPQAADPKPAPTGTPRAVRVVLALSLAANLGVAGLVAGAFIADGGPRDRMVRDLDFGPFTEALTREDRDALRREFLRVAPDMRDMKQAMKQDFAAVMAAVRAEPFDAAALQAAVDALGKRAEGRVEIGQKLLVERLSAMSAADRAAFADRLEHRLRHGGGHD